MKNHKLFWGSSYDRGVDILLNMWPQIKGKFKDAELHLTYGWEVFDRITGTNAERQQWKRGIQELMKQDGITYHGRLGKEDLANVRSECGIWAYPTNFNEIFCITALESQQSGCVPVTMVKGSLPEVVGSGVLVEGDINDKKIQAKYLEELLALMGDEVRWRAESVKAKKFVKKFTWSATANAWETEFVKRMPQDVKVTIYTPTIRRGFWNIMADNLSKQTYKNIEWIIVDDYPEDRSNIATKYAKKYNLDIRYMRGRERAKKRTYGLVNANNTALDASTGDLFVFLQDFILIPVDGIEQLVNLHLKNKDALLAPCDIYYLPKLKPNSESEDWFDGELDVIGEFKWANRRIEGVGLRESINPFDFEQNWGAIPTEIARTLGGWYELMDEGLGFDNTDIALRALKAGYRIIIDDTNLASCIDHWEVLRGKNENGGMLRARRLNDPRFLWLKEMLDMGKLPIFRTQAVDDKIDLQYTVPKEVSDNDMKEWVAKEGAGITHRWLEEYKDVDLSK